jgi:Tol biopolymer transport system component
MQNNKRVLIILLAVIAVLFTAGCLVVAFGASALSTFTTTRSQSSSAVSGYIPYEEQVEVAGPIQAENQVISLIDVSVEIGVGSPIPVEVVVIGEWPDLCAQLAQVNLSFQEQNQIYIDLLATPANASCPPDRVGLRFGLRIPLNMVEMQPGTYTVIVNGQTTSFDWPAQGKPQSNTPAPLRMAYIGADGNVWLLDFPEGTPRQMTIDASSQGSGDNTITYNEPRLSSDGLYLAYRRGAGTPRSEGMQYTFGLWIANLETRESTLVYEKSPAGYNWQPGSHLLAYIPELDAKYFTIQNERPSSDYADGIMGFDVDSGSTIELVKPEHGYALYGPVWSPDGSFLSFDEVLYMEGRGPFAYYDFDLGQYVAWDKPLGNYAWSPDGERIAFDNLTYAATGNERIHIRERKGSAETPFSVDLDPGYATLPAFSPQGDQIAYLVKQDGPGSQHDTLVVQGYPAGEPRQIGVFENVYTLNWTSDGTHLVFSFGAWGEQNIAQVNLLDGSIMVLVAGMQPSLSVQP